jgi:hypothetical protein
MRASVAGLVLGVLAVGSVHAQYMISAHSGVVQYVEGTAYLNDQQIEPRAGEFPNIKENQVFRTSEGMAEVLLTPGVFLRMGENSSIKMVSNKLTDTRVEVMSGSAMVECDIAKDNAITLLAKGNEMSLVKHGLYRVDADQGLFKVYDGEATVKNDSGQVTLHKGKQTLLTGALMAENFDPKADDDLYRWSDRRSGYLAKANVSSANNIISGGSGYGGSGYAGLGAGLGYPGMGYAGLGAGGLGYGGFPGDCLGGSFGLGAYSPWQFNPMFGMYTYVPCAGAFYSPFGYGFYSPYTVYQAPVYYGGGGGTAGTGTSRTGTGTGKHSPFLPTRSSAVASRGSSSTGGFSGLARGGSALSSSSSSASVSSGGHLGGGGSSGGHGR